MWVIRMYENLHKPFNCDNAFKNGIRAFFCFVFVFHLMYCDNSYYALSDPSTTNHLKNKLEQAEKISNQPDFHDP